MKDAIKQIETGIQNLRNGLVTEEECWNHIIHMVVATTTNQVNDVIINANKKENNDG